MTELILNFLEGRIAVLLQIYADRVTFLSCQKWAWISCHTTPSSILKIFPRVFPSPMLVATITPFFLVGEIQTIAKLMRLLPLCVYAVPPAAQEGLEEYHPSA